VPRPTKNNVAAVQANEAGVTEVQLVANLKHLYRTNPTLTRDFYRANGRYAEREWQKFYVTFSDFLAAAGIPTSSEHRKAIREKAKQHAVPIESDEVTGDLRSIKLLKTRISSLEELLEHCKVDTALWEVERFVVNKWETAAAEEDTATGKKTILTEPLFQVKATLRKKLQVQMVRAEITSLKEEAKQLARFPKVIPFTQPTSGNMLEINIPDSHFGKLAWSRETGGPNYDTTIAEHTYLRALETIIDRSKGYVFDQVLFVVGNDILNSDNLEGTTTKGTYVSTDGRYQKTFAVVRRTITKAIERLRCLAPSVKVVMVSGNHDDLSVWHLGDSLECTFANYADVVIENEPTYYKWHQHGKVMLMFTHGDKGKRTDYPLLMATERPAMFGSTRFRETHTGHTHMTKTDEQHGVRVRVLPALCPADAWHAENGFVGNLRSAEGFVWNKDEGLIAQVFHNEDAHAPIETKLLLAA
jgi:hypothetical protein